MDKNWVLCGTCQGRQLVTSQTHESRLSLEGVEFGDQDKLKTPAAELNIAVASTLVAGLSGRAG